MTTKPTTPKAPKKSKLAIPPPPDKDAQLDMLRYRCHVAELTVYRMVDSNREMLKGFESVLKQIHELNKKYPLGDETSQASMQLAVNAVRTLPAFAGMTDDQIEASLAKGA
jgi:hypothetical protein